MHTIVNWIIVWASNLKLPKQFEFIDLIQILLIAWVLYNLFVWIKTTKAYTLIKGLFMIGVFWFIAFIFKMQTILWLTHTLGSGALVAIVIIFQPELRRVVEQLGEKNPLNGINFRSSQDEVRFSDQTINELVRAVFDMAEVKTGALIVIERNITLEEYEQTGIPIDATLTNQLLINIFEKNTPLHDGAVIVRDNRVAAATCYLPLSENKDLSKHLGTRHRAGIGISERTDSFTIIVSEETGKVSFASGGRLHPIPAPSDLREQLYQVQSTTLRKASDKTAEEKRYRFLLNSGKGEGEKR